MKLTIITPCFNSEKTIERTIKSVVNQKLSINLEYIIIDGLSKDNTLNIIRRYAKKYDFIKYISEKDNSMTEALNKGLKMATGDIITTINADYEYLENSLNKICNKFIESEEKKIIIANTYFVYEETGDIKAKNKPKWFNPLLCGIIECPFPECSIFFRRECFDRVGVFNENIKYTQDLELYLRMYESKYKFYYENIDVSNFYISSTNYSSTIMDKMEDEVVSYFKYKKIFRFFAHSTLSKIIKVVLGVRQYRYKNIRINKLKCKVMM